MTDRCADAMRVRIRPGIESNKEASLGAPKYFDSCIHVMHVRHRIGSENNKEADGGISNNFDSYVGPMRVRSRRNHLAPGSAMMSL